MAFVPVQMKNLDSPTLNSTLFKDMDTCRAAVTENVRGTEKDRRRKQTEKEKIGLVITAVRVQNTKDVHHFLICETQKNTIAFKQHQIFILRRFLLYVTTFD